MSAKVLTVWATLVISVAALTSFSRNSRGASACKSALFEALGDMPTKRLLREGDLIVLGATAQPPGCCDSAYVGKFLRADLKKGARIELMGLDDAALSDVAVVRRVLVSPLIAAHMNAGGRVDLFGGSAPICRDVPVIAVSAHEVKPALLLDVKKAAGCEKALTAAGAVPLNLEPVQWDHRAPPAPGAAFEQRETR